LVSYTTSNSFDSNRNATALVAEKSILKPQITQNVVYLGKRSRARDCETKNDDTHPFGCGLLKDIVAGKDDQYLGTDISATTGVFVRLSAPIVIGRKRTKTCPVRVPREGEKIELNGVLTLVYAGDTFYWGTVGGNLQECLPQSVIQALRQD
jgi:hypothetical protein